jgi:hypothetical protein
LGTSVLIRADRNISCNFVPCPGAILLLIMGCYDNSAPSAAAAQTPGHLKSTILLQNDVEKLFSKAPPSFVEMCDWQF